MPPRLHSLVATVALVFVLVAAPAAARHRGDDVRVEASCGSGASARLRLKPDHDLIRVEFELESRRARERWRLVLVHERRVVWRGTARTRSGSTSFRVRRSVPDFDGADEVSLRAAGPNGNTCQATATLTARD